MSLDLEALQLPESIIDYVRARGMIPFEDIALAVLAEKVPDIPCGFELPDRFDYEFFALVRRRPGLGYWSGDPRFVDFGALSVWVFARDNSVDPNGEVKAAVVSEAIRIAFTEAGLEHKRYPGLGTIQQLRLLEEANRSADWAPSAGPVQYADLPKNLWRYESLYQMKVKRDLKR